MKDAFCNKGRDAPGAKESFYRYHRSAPTDRSRPTPELETMSAGCHRIAVSPAEMYRLLGLKKVKGVKAGKRTLFVVSA